MDKLWLSDGSAQWEATLVEARTPARFAVFAVGGGGNPERHLPLLTALAEHGVTVVAPHFERLASPQVTEDDLRLRARRLRLAMDRVVPDGAAVIGVGHSIGSTALLTLAGGQAWMGPGRPVKIERDGRLRGLALLTPATGFFQAPGALAEVNVPILAWAGTQDTITPPIQAEMLVRALQDRTSVEVRVEHGAGHFSFMHVPPPHATETLPDREAFLARLTAEVVTFTAAFDSGDTDACHAGR